MKLTARYSGEASKDIWDRVAAISHEPSHGLLYIAACALQDHEQRFLQILVRVEQDDLNQQIRDTNV